MTVVITKATAERYFPNEDPIGKQLEIGNEYGIQKFTVTAIAENFPKNTYYGFDFLCEFNSPFKGAKWFVNNWQWSAFPTYVSFEQGYTMEDILAQFPEYLKKYKTDKIAPGRTWNFRFEPISRSHLRIYAPNVPENSPERNNLLIKILAILIVIVSWVNYINLSTAGASERAKEVGIRKTIGATKKHVIIQFLLEVTILNIVASLLATGLVFLCFNSFSEFIKMGFSIDILYQKEVWLYLIGISITGIIASGLYPSVILSSFQSIDVLKTKSITSPASSTVRKILVGVQFFISMAFITITSILVHQSEFYYNLPTGIDYSNKITIREPKFIKKEVYINKYPSFIEQLKQIPEVKSVAPSYHTPPYTGTYNSAWLISKGEESKAIYDIDGIDENYIPDYGLKIIAGRNFKSKDIGSEDEIILSKKVAERLGFEKAEEALDAELRITGFNERIFSVVGVIDNYKYTLRNSKLRGNMIVQNTGYMSGPKCYSVTVHSMKNIKLIEKKLKEVFDQNFPDDIFINNIVTENYEKAMERQTATRNLSIIFSILAIILAFVGVFGLASFIALLKTKEIGLRKVFGANFSDIAWVLSKEFIIILTIVALIVSPLLFLIMESYLNQFQDRIELNIWHFSIAILGVGIIILFVVAFNL